MITAEGFGLKFVAVGHHAINAAIFAVLVILWRWYLI